MWSLGKVPQNRVQMCRKSPCGSTCWLDLEITHKTSDVVLPSYLEVPLVVVIQGFEELIRARDVRDHLKFSLPTPETNVKWFLKLNNRQRRKNDIYSSVSRFVEVIFAFSTLAEQLWSCGQRQQLSQLRTRNADNTTDFMWKTIQSLAEFISHILLFDYLLSIRHNDKFIWSRENFPF